MRILAVILSIVAVIGAAGLGSDGMTFFDVPAVLFVLLFGTGITAAAHGFSAIPSLLQAFVRPVPNPQQTRRIAQTARKAFVAAGWVGFLIGVVQILSSLDNPSQLGPAAAVALLTAFYGYCVAYIICLPVERSVAG